MVAQRIVDRARRTVWAKIAIPGDQNIAGCALNRLINRQVGHQTSQGQSRQRADIVVDAGETAQIVALLGMNQLGDAGGPVGIQPFTL